MKSLNKTHPASSEIFASFALASFAPAPFSLILLDDVVLAQLVPPAARRADSP